MSKSFDQERAEKAISELLLAIGEDPNREGLRDTPKRVARALQENFQGLYQDPKDVLTTTFDIGHDELVIVKDIEVYSHCEHHLTPFHGVAHIGYIPGPSGKVTGLSKLPVWLIYMPAAHKFKNVSPHRLQMRWLRFFNLVASLSSLIVNIYACRCAEYESQKLAPLQARSAECSVIQPLAQKQCLLSPQNNVYVSDGDS